MKKVRSLCLSPWSFDIDHFSSSLDLHHAPAAEPQPAQVTSQVPSSPQSIPSLSGTVRNAVELNTLAYTTLGDIPLEPIVPEGFIASESGGKGL